ncbi:MAG: RHS repeat protein, partial [Xanthomonadaceae bacterium]|nr:RHS repeat protein [Xanthomonadaceae bacterium]
MFEYENYVCWAYLDKSVACNPNGKPLLVVHAYNPSGYATHFRLNNGVWTSAAGDIAQLVNGDWVIDYRDGSRNTFGTNGKPKTIQDERGIGLIYNYNASNQLLSVAHTSGRTLSLTWSSGKVTAITAPNGKTYSYAYDGNDYLASVTYPDNLGTRTYHYEDSAQPGGLTGLSINDVRQTRYKYYADGRVEWSGFDGGAERSTFAYGTDYTSVTNALGQATMYRLVELGGIKRIWRVERPVSGTCAPGIVDSQYDANGNVDYEVDALGVKTDYSYDAEDRLTQKITGIGPANQTDQQQITQYVWDASRKGRLNQVKVFGTGTSQPLNTTTYTYYPDGDARARLLKSVAVANQGDGTLGTLTTAYDYTLHPNDLVATMTVDGPLSGSGDALTYTYDTAGNLLTVKNSLNHTTTYSNYTALGQPGTITTPNGAVTQYTYNARGQVLTEKKTVNGAVQTTTTAYDTRGRPVQVTTPDGEVIDTAYDAYDRVTSVSKTEYLPDIGDPGDTNYQYDRRNIRQQAIAYNLLSQPTSVTTSFRYRYLIWIEVLQKDKEVGTTTTQQKVSYEYDAGGFLSKRKGEDGQALTYHYNANGDVDQVKDALNNTTSYAYDRHRRISAITDAAGTTQIDYNPLGLTLQVRDARNNSTTYGYDGLGNLLTQASPDTGTTGFTYNSAGQRTQMQRADASTVSYTYDTLGRLATQSGSGQTRTLTYDGCTNGKGLLCSATKTGGTATTASFAYTPWGQVATRQDTLNGTTDTIGYSYDGMHRLAGIAYPGGVSVGYGYSDGRVATITATVNGTTSTVATLDGYQAFGPPVYLTYGNGLFRTTNYDTDRRITGISTNAPGGPIQSLTYGFDAADRITAITNGIDAGQTQQ